MANYKSIYTGEEIDAGIAKANTAIQDVSDKQDTLVSGENIKTINNTSILGSGNINIEGGGGESVHEVYIGDTEPSEASVLLWVDTSGEPSPGTTNPVTNLAGTTTSNSATLTWIASSNATSYKIYQGNNFIDSTASTTHTVGNLVASTEYVFGVVATGESGDSTKVTVTLTTQASGGGSLPAEYQEVNYVMSPAVAYDSILLGIKLSDTDKIQVTTEQDFGHMNALFERAATFNTGENTDYASDAVIWNPTTSAPWEASVWRTDGNSITNFTTVSDPSEYVGLNIKASFTFEFKSSSDNYWAIGNLASQSAYFVNQKIYDLKFYKNDTLVADFVPCYRKSDNKVGMYDLINERFVTSHSGVSSWAKGADVNE